MPLPRIDLYVAGGIAEREQERDRLRERLQEFGVDLGAARAVREAAAKGPLRAGEPVSPQAVIAFFGRPAIRRVERLAWELTLWPEHRFEISLRTFGSDGRTVIRRDGDGGGPPPLPAPPASLDEALRVLRPWYHTRRDLARTLGDPVREGGAPPHEWDAWRLADGSLLAGDFTDGLLLALREAPAEEPRAAARRWWAPWRR